jgi:hypothetical protein
VVALDARKRPGRCVVAFRFVATTLGEVTRWLLRFFCNGPRTYASTRSPPPQAKAPVRNDEVETVADRLTKRQVPFRSIADFASGGPLLVATSEQEAR